MPDVCHNAAWKLRSLLDRAGVRPLAAPSVDPLVTGLTDDSRKVQPGDCFVAVRGNRFDGHRCIGDAVAAGAAVVVSERPPESDHPVVSVQVSDSRLALARLSASYYRIDKLVEHGDLRLVGVTGTNGKTTVCAMLRDILHRAGRVTASFGTLQNDTIRHRSTARLTTPSALDLCAALAEASDAGATDAVIEVSSHALDQHRCGGLRFAVGVFTNLSQDHLDYHATMESYADCKRRLFEGLEDGASAVVNADDPWSRRMVDAIGAGVVRFGRQAGADVMARVVRFADDGVRVNVRIKDGGDLAIRCPMVGVHNVYNALAAIAAARALKVPLNVIGKSIESFAGVNGRLQRVGLDDLPYRVYVDYAHTPDALAQALAAVRSVTRGRIICVFGCGGERDRDKRPQMGKTVSHSAEVAIVTSDNPRGEDPQSIIDDVTVGMDAPGECLAITETDRRRAIQTAISLANPNDTVLIAGKGHENYQLIGDRRIPFDDRGVVLEAIAELEGVRR